MWHSKLTGIVAMPHSHDPISASDIISDGLQQLTPFTAFKSNHNAAIIRNTLEALFPAVCDNTTYNLTCEIFLQLAYDRCENTKRNFRIVLYRTNLKVFIQSEDIFEQDAIFDFHYAFVFERPRVSWHRHWMRNAHLAASRTTCRAGRAVGVQFTNNKVPLLSGYNGVPPDYPHPKSCIRVDRKCPTGEGLDLCPCAHAEINAIAMASKRGISLEDSVVYVTSRPCAGCMGALAILKPNKIVFEDSYDGADLVSDIAKHANIPLINIRELTDD